MNTLYICSEEAVAPCNDWTKKLTEKLGNAEKAMDAVSSVLSECSGFAAINSDSYEDVRNNYFTDETFIKSREMENLKRETEEMIRLAARLRERIERAKHQMENLEFAYSEDFEKWYDEEHQYDYERA